MEFSAATRAWFGDTFARPTRVQAEGWPHIARGDNALLLAPTGSGKTLAAFLAALDKLTRLPLDAEPGVRVLYISPLKALVYDIERNLRAPLVGLANAATRLGDTLRPIRVDIRTGDTDARDRRLQARDPAEVLVTTPESLYLLLGSQARDTLRTVETVIVDEIHVLAGSKRGSHLALSLERLAALTDRDPQRIGLSATQRPLELVARFLGGDRDVKVVDTSEPPRIDLHIVVPVEDMDRPVAAGIQRAQGGDGQFQRVGGRVPATDGPNTLQHGLWPTIYPKILELIRAHRSTIVFTNSRLLCERLAQRLNELAGEDLVRAHHGSISHAQRNVTEEMLKQGKLPAIVATSSLELGIDMGAVDLVVLVESPGAVSRGLQRIGRAGHGVGETSIGRIFPKFKGDLVECAVVANRMVAGEIEHTAIPRNCLDVLAQQIVAAVAMDDWATADLAALIRRAFPYRELTDTLLVSVLDMLAGRYPSDAFADLAPRLTWDRSTDTLKPRRGSKTIALMNAGTIPDRGLYAVFLAGDDGPRLGELDEEMVYESRSGDTIILGASTWRIEEITRDRVIVSPAPGEPGRLPFWHGDRPGRPVDLGRALGAYVREVADLPEKSAVKKVASGAPLDELAARNLVSYVREQRELTEVVPSDRTLVVERFRDELGDWRVCILSPFGTRVHAPWAMAIEAALSGGAGFEIQSLWTDDGISLRFADTDELPDTEHLFPDPDELEDLVVQQLGRSAMFAARFRENAARSLLLPRRSFKGRSPLWQQRLKAQQLQAVATSYPAFPIVLETYRECLQDVFDLPALRELLAQIRRRDIAIHEVETRRASPFARSLVFAYVAAYMYEGDAPLAERKAHALTLDRSLLRELLGQEELRELLDHDALTDVEAELQWLVPERAARDADALHDLLRRLGDLDTDELQARAAEPVRPWLRKLETQRRAIPVRIAGRDRWIAAEDAGRYRDALGVPVPPGLPAAFLEAHDAPLESLILRWARTHGPFTAGPLANRFGLQPAVVQAVLRGLEARDLLMRGGLRPGGEGEEWCDPDVMRRLRRRSLAKLRREVEPVEGDVYARFLVGWHGIGSPRGGPGRLSEVLDQLEGLPLPFSTLESNVLPARIKGYEPRMLDELGMMGMVVWLGRGALGSKDGRIALYRRDRVGLLVDPPEIEEAFFAEGTPDGPLRQRLWEHLQSRGACFLIELQMACGDTPLADVTRALWDLVWAGLVTNDTFLPLRGLRSNARQGSARRARAQTAGGRWSAVTSLIGPPADPTERAHARAIQLLDRYGVATSAAAKAEALPGGFGAVYPVLRAMEESGKARRGWFIDGLGGAQFAMAGAVDRLRGHRQPSSDAVVLSAVDPASPWGAVLPWPERPEPQPRREAGALVVLVGGAPVLWLGKGAKSLVTFPCPPSAFDAAVQALRGQTALRRTLRIDRIDGDAALDSPHRARFLQAGFAADYKGLVLG
ncbi:MAG: DEAD/DEAH box helicase [Alphaproteobacteria bacterium]|nr:DEAD/DEAH box helicase [Alphaproteobacteria bacterium]